MTEQENREKAIEELAQFMCETKDKMTCEECKREPNVQCGAWNEATRIYDAGYRKVDKDGTFHIDISEELTKDFFQNEIKEARKETIKEFVKMVKRCLPNEPYLHTWLREIAFGKFGVEVEE